MQDKTWQAAVAKTNRLQRELDITNADHIALWIEANTIPDEPMNQCASWLACRIIEAHEAAMQTHLTVLVERDEWRDMSSAPRDGTKVLVARFVDKCQHGKNGRVRVDFWRSRDRYDFEGWGEFNLAFWPPTHWQPLPAPPTEGRK